jgi:hypothetical protein
VIRKGLPSWSRRVNSGTVVCLAMRPISPFFGGRGKWPNAGAAKRHKSIVATATRLLTLELELIGNIELFGPIRQITAD